LLPPSRLVGRDDEIAALEAAFHDALAGRCRAVLIGGPPGVGKTALVDQLRPVVTGGDGWFVAGKFDQYRRDLEADAVHQAGRALGRLLLAEPEDELAEVRERILATVGANAGLLAATTPELAALMAVPPDPGDPLTAQARAQRTAAGLLRAAASRKRPLVVVVDDLQWAGRTALGFVDLVLSEEPIEGLLLAATYRDDEVDGAHPLAEPLSRWRHQSGVQTLRLDNLPPTSLAAMVAEMLHVSLAAAQDLADVLRTHTAGNPYQTVELLEELRRGGQLTATASRWQWDIAAVGAHLGDANAVALPVARAEVLPQPSRAMVEAMACLGGWAEVGLLQTATGEQGVEQALRPALEGGLLVAEPGLQQAVRFRHDRLREAILAALDPSRRRDLHLGMARRLAPVPEFFSVAAEQYLPVTDAVDDPVERRRVVWLLRRAAEQASLIGDHARVNTLLTAALPLIAPGEVAMLTELHTARHAALYSLGRLEEADEEYRTIEQLSPETLGRAKATAVQVRSLTNRNRHAKALRLGIESLRELGTAVPAADSLAAALEHQSDHLYRWLGHTDAADDLARPAIVDPAVIAVSGLINATLVPAYFTQDLSMHAWLSLEALRILIEHGPDRALIAPACQAGASAIVLRGDYLAAYHCRRRLLALGEARGYEPGTSEVRFLFALLSCWAEPIESGVEQARRARDGLIAACDLANAAYTYSQTVFLMLDCEPALASYAAEAEAGLAFLRRTGNEQTAQLLESYRWLIDVLRGERSAVAGEPVPAEGYAANPAALFHAHCARALAAAIFGDPAGLARHTAAAMPLLPAATPLYPIAVARLLRGLALARQARDADGEERAAVLSELGEVTRWLAARATDAADNFAHLVRLLEAERAWALGDAWAAALAFDAARQGAADGRRPWHRALITERAARFHLTHGLEHIGSALLAETRDQYAAWGATAKVAQLDWAYPSLRPGPGTPGPGTGPSANTVQGWSTVTTGTLDLLGILSASQALSSETNVEKLHARVVEVLGALTGATAVHLLLWDEDRQDWLLPVPAGIVQVGAGHETAAPLSVLRYIARTGEPLVVGDATADDRFARDVYLADADRCSLLALPILSRGALRAVLVLENRLLRDAFTATRLDAVKLIAGQLAVSLENAQVYAEFRRIADEQAALRRVATLVAQGVPPTAVFDAVAAEIERLLDADGVTLQRYEPGEEATVVAHQGAIAEIMPPGLRFSHRGGGAAALVRRSGGPARAEHYQDTTGTVSQLARAGGARMSVAAPVMVDGRLWGVAIAYWTRDQAPSAGTEERMAAFAQLLETAIANADSRAELMTSRARIVAAADDARRQIERDLHDGAQQRLVSLGLRLRAAQAALRPDDAARLDPAVAEAAAASDELREIARGIHPAVLADGGLRSALKALARRSTVPVDLDMRLEGRLPERVEVSAYYVVAEALTNAAKHARASAITVTIDADAAGTVLRVAVRDDGAGGAELRRGTGLAGLKDRVEALGGRIVLDSPPGAGTSLRAELPLTSASPDITVR
ncbi:MAG TPA: AAA family ATPase, partial [Streptosporangiaceae bacterium]|nr:AAA family ATPase [Streptosporangiaceae bacterium]